MEVELVWLEGEVPVVLAWQMPGSTRFDAFFESLPNDLREKLRTLQACRFARKVVASTVIEAGDQIAWLPNLRVDPQAARVARVEKQRKERWRIRSIPKK
jgi:putative ubiquitin-RnfH superfamily antitoxin RatB of RatAB toxin-antitoxin module